MTLAYHHTPRGKQSPYPDAPGVLFLSGFHSTMQGNKALALEQFCQEHGMQYTRFDYTGHGESPGNIDTGTIEQWRDDALEILDSVCTGSQLLVGSSMGAWLATLVAIERSNRVSALLGIAAAPDFTHRLLEPQLSESQKQALNDGKTIALDSRYDEQNPHRFQQGLIDSGKALSVLNRSVPINCPVRLLHGTADTDVPWSLSVELLEAIQSDIAQLVLVKGADHRFSSPEQLQLITEHLSVMLALA